MMMRRRRRARAADPCICEANFGSSAYSACSICSSRCCSCSLSEHEQHLLEQMEQALYAEDPKFASQMQGSAARARLRRRIIVGGVFVIVGLGLVFLTVVQDVVWWGAVGFALMVGGVVYAITPAKTPKVTLGAVGV